MQLNWLGKVKLSTNLSKSCNHSTIEWPQETDVSLFELNYRKMKLFCWLLYFWIESLDTNIGKQITRRPSQDEFSYADLSRLNDESNNNSKSNPARKMLEKRHATSQLGKHGQGGLVVNSNAENRGNKSVVRHQVERLYRKNAHQKGNEEFLYDAAIPAVKKHRLV